VKRLVPVRQYTSPHRFRLKWATRSKSDINKVRVAPTGYVLADGAGLSRHNLVSPEAITQTLRAMAQLPASVYRASLPVAAALPKSLS